MHLSALAYYEPNDFEAMVVFCISTTSLRNYLLHSAADGTHSVHRGGSVKCGLSFYFFSLYSSGWMRAVSIQVVDFAYPICVKCGSRWYKGSISE